MKSIKIFICEDCTVVFQVYGMNRKKKYHCPNCGDAIAVRPYQGERYSENITRTRWTEEELALMQECLNGKLQPYQVAIQIGRSANSVSKKMQRMRKLERR